MNFRNSSGKLFDQAVIRWLSNYIHIACYILKRLYNKCKTADVRAQLYEVEPAFFLLVLSLPASQVNLKKGVPPDSNNETCTAGAGSLLVEFGILSRLLGDSTFEWVARRAVKALWSLRSNNTGLLGNLVRGDAILSGSMF